MILVGIRNRRKSFGVEPEPFRPVRVDLGAFGARNWAWLANISAESIAVRIEPGPPLDASAPHRLEIHLWGGTHPPVVAHARTVRNEPLPGDRVLYAFRIVEERTCGHWSEMQRLLAYVMDRQLAVIARIRDRRRRGGQQDENYSGDLPSCR